MYLGTKLEVHSVSGGKSTCHVGMVGRFEVLAVVLMKSYSIRDVALNKFARWRQQAPMKPGNFKQST